jgi:hypothetical protein
VGGRDGHTGDYAKIESAEEVCWRIQDFLAKPIYSDLPFKESLPPWWGKVRMGGKKPRRSPPTSILPHKGGGSGAAC